MKNIIIMYIISVMKILKPALIIIAIILIIAEAFYLFAVPRIIDYELKNNAVERVVEEYTGLIFSKEKLVIKTRPDFSVSVSADNIRIDSKLNENVFSSKKINLRISLISLLFNAPDVKQFQMHDSVLKCAMDESGNLYFGTYKFDAHKNPQLNLNKISADISNLKIMFYSKGAGQNVEIEIPNLRAGKYVKNKYLDILADAKIITGKKTASVKINAKTSLPIEKNLNNLSVEAKISQLDLGAFSDFLKFYADKNLKNASGIINADIQTEFVHKRNNLILNAQITGFSMNMNNPTDSFGSALPLSLSLKGQADSKKFNVEKFVLNTAEWKIFSDGQITNLKKNSADLDLNLKIPKSKLNPLYHLIPSLPDSNDAIQKLKKYGVWADVEADLKIKGKSENPEIHGPMVLSDLYILKYDSRIPKCKIDITFHGLEFDLYTKVFARVNQFVEVKGTADNKLGGKGDFLIKSSPSVDLMTAHTLLMPIHDVVGFDLGPLPYMALDGEGNIDIHTKGTVLDGYVDGIFNFKDTTAVLKGLNTKLTNASGFLSFKGKDMHFQSRSANINNSNIKVSGDADLDGNIDFNVSSESIDSSELISLVKGSPDLKAQAQLLESLEQLSGDSSVQLDIKGQVKDFNNLMEKVNLRGKLVMKNNTAKTIYSPVFLQKINGTVEFEDINWKINSSAYVFDSKFLATAKSEKQKLWAAVKCDDLKIDNVLNSSFIVGMEGKELKNLPKTNSTMALRGEYSGDIKKPDYDKVKLSGYFKPSSLTAGQPLVIDSGSVELESGNLNIKNFSAKVFNSSAKFDGTINKFFSKSPVADYRVNINNFDVSSFDRLKNMRFVPSYLRKILNTYENYSGRADVDIECKNNHPNGKVRLQEIKFTQKSLSIPIIVYSGDVVVDGNTISIKSLNAAFDNNPVFINASLKDLKTAPKFSGYITAKLTESFVNKYINNNLTSPIKPKGDITLTSEFSGDGETLNIKPKLKLSQGSDIYYMGANLGDTDDLREVRGDISFKGNVIDLKRLSYLRYMTSQNDYTYPLEIINAYGRIIRNKNVYTFSPLRVSTLNNANVRLFNVVFRKSVLKQGMFNCNLTFRGNAAAPDITGDAVMMNLDMPLYDTLIKDIKVKFTKKLINLRFNGQIFDSDFDVDAILKNSVALPVVIQNVKVNSKILNLDTIIDSMTKVTLSNITPSAGKIVEDEKNMDVSDFVVEKGEMRADSMILRGMPASNYRALFTLGEDSLLKVSGLSFEIADGQVSGLAGYNFKNAKLNAELSAKDVDSNKMATAFFDVKDQIFGRLDGTAVITTSGIGEEERLRNVFGTVYFVIKDGKMPKLGSIEYLLKASNLIKSGITGLSINNFIDLIAPVKTGYFNSIKGLIILKEGKAQNLEIYSSGDTLSLFIKGQFDFPQQDADLTVFGRLTKKADNMLGVVGNASFNSLLNLIPGFRLDNTDKAKIIQDLNKIPGVEFNDQRYRIFSAKINGDINGEKYVKSFKWIE